MKGIIFILLVSAISIPAIAAERVKTSWFKIEQAGADSNGPFIVHAPAGTTLENLPEVVSCGAGFNWGIGTAELTEDGYNTSISVALAAFMARKEVQIDYDKSLAGCYVYRIRVR